MLNVDLLTLEEKIKLLSGKSGDLVAQKFGQKYLSMSDGPHGVRSHGVCYPNMCLIAGSWDKDVLYQMGRSIGNDCIAEGVDVILGPSVNIKRTPLCGRNFEYISEDPLLAGTLTAAFINGVQSKNVFACVKHFCCYNQEKNRFTQDVNIDEETLMNLYIRVFGILLKKSKPAFLMTSYNKINGEFVSQSRYLITDVLKRLLGFDGIVITDWGGVDYRQKAMAAGVDINMPGDECSTVSEVLESYKDLGIDEREIDRSVSKIISAIRKAEKVKSHTPTDITKLRRIAAECMVLLKNEGVLPITANCQASIIGDLAIAPTYQGGGCAEIRNATVETPYNALCGMLKRHVPFERGYVSNGEATDDSLERQAVSLAEQGGTILYFMGLPSCCESEGYDRESIRLPGNQIALLKKIYRVNPEVVVILTNGSSVELGEVVTHSKAVLECFYAGEVFAGALSDVLIGEVNPSGRLAETFPERLEDTVSSVSYVDENDSVFYTEGAVAGYSYCQSNGTAMRFPFGYGLSYTTFDYLDFRASATMTFGEAISVSVTLKNSGRVTGKEVVQIYLQKREESFRRLAAFEKVELRWGESKTVKLVLEQECFQKFSAAAKNYVLNEGSFTLALCRDCQTPLMSLPLTVKTKFTCTCYTKIGELRKVGNAPQLIEKYLSKCIGMAVMGNPEYPIRFRGREIEDKPFVKNVAYSMPLYLFTTLTAGMMNNARLEEVIGKINRELSV